MHTTTSKITIKAPAQKVWDALTTPELVKRWQYGSQLSTTWEAGTSIRFRSEWEGQVYEQWGTVIEFSPPTSLKYTLFAPRPDLTDVPENYFVMSYALDETGGSTILTITQEDPRPGAGDGDPDPGEENGVLKTLKKIVEAE
jgi:uncharacterized protein YndB with AHSA1/START domain